MKTQGKLLRSILLTSLLSLTVLLAYAEGDEKRKVSSHKMVVFAEQLNQIVNVVEEMELKIENWMKQEDFIEDLVSSESELQIENWMTDTESLDPVIYEDNLAIEDWMLETITPDYSGSEEELSIEPWMKDNDYLINTINKDQIAISSIDKR